jgi:hypothetical protein
MLLILMFRFTKSIQEDTCEVMSDVSGVIFAPFSPHIKFYPPFTVFLYPSQVSQPPSPTRSRPYPCFTVPQHKIQRRMIPLQVSILSTLNRVSYTASLYFAYLLTGIMRRRFHTNQIEASASYTTSQATSIVNVSRQRGERAV